MPEEAMPGMEGLEGVEGVRIRGSLPRKRRVNLAKVTKTRLPWARILLVALGVLMVCVGAVRYGVLARFEALRAARENLRNVRDEFEAAEETLNDYYKSRDVYVHITWSDMTAEEIGMVDPTDIANLLERVVLPFSPLDGWSLSDNAVTLTVHAATLEDINELARRLREEPMVKYCTVHGGGRSVTQDGGLTGVSSSISIYFNDADNTKIGTARKEG